MRTNTTPATETPNTPTEVRLLSDALLHIVIAAFAAGVAYGRGEPPPSRGATDDPAQTWVRLARLAYIAAERAPAQSDDAPDWLRELQERYDAYGG